MTAQQIDILELPSGRFKVYVMGQADGHISDWRGCNFRTWAVPGQPRNGFADLMDACRFKDGLDVDETMREAKRHGGSFYGDRDPKSHVQISDEVQARKYLRWVDAGRPTA